MKVIVASIILQAFMYICSFYFSPLQWTSDMVVRQLDPLEFIFSVYVLDYTYLEFCTIYSHFLSFLFLPTAVNLRHSGPTAEPARVPDNKAVRAVRLTSPVSLQSFFLSKINVD